MSLDRNKIISLKDNFGRAHVPMLEDTTMGAYEKLCFVVMSSFGEKSWAGMKAIARRMSVAVKTARRARQKLEKAGWITFIGKDQWGRKEWTLDFTRIPWALGEGTGGLVGGHPGGGEGGHLVPIKQEVQATNAKHLKKEEGSFPESGEEREPEGKGNPNPQEDPIPRPNPTPGPTPTQGPAPTCSEKKPRSKKDTQGVFRDLEESPIGKKFRAAYKVGTTFTYFFKAKDADAIPNVSKLGLDDSQLDTALGEFFAPGSWYVTNGNTGFKTFVDKAQSLVVAARSKPGKSNGAPSRRYVPWDPRHPSYNPNDSVQRDQKANWEVENGLWKPRP